ncbi:hypothetical protein BaRGS_00019016, partial [Batillaria attramentaria]
DIFSFTIQCVPVATTAREITVSGVALDVRMVDVEITASVTVGQLTGNHPSVK